MLDKHVPGPGKYNTTKPFGSEAPRFSMYSKRGYISEMDKSKIPGPGFYKTRLNPDGRSPNSMMKNLHNVTWSSSKSQRFVDASNIYLI
jgi:hypothetical protein